MSRARVLLVEDDPGYATTVQEMLPTMDVVVAGSYDEGLAAIEQLGNFDCALVDLNLIDNDDGRGRVIIDTIKQQQPHFPVAAVTAHSVAQGSSFDSVLRDLNADDLIQKSATPGHGYDVTRVVARLLSGDMVPFVAQRSALLYERLAVEREVWLSRQAGAEGWRMAVQKAFGQLHASATGDGLVTSSSAAVRELTQIRDGSMRQLGLRSSIGAVDQATKDFESTVDESARSWASAAALTSRADLRSRLARWISSLDMTILVVVAGVCLAFAGEIAVRWRLDSEELAASHWLILLGGLVAGVSTMSLAAVSDRISDLATASWSDGSDAHNAGLLLATALRSRLCSFGFATVGGIFCVSIGLFL